MINTSTRNIYSVVNIKMKVPFNYKQILSCKAIKFLADIHVNFNDRRLELLTIRKEKNNHQYNLDVILDKVGYFRDREVKVFGIDGNELRKQPISSNGKMFIVNFGTELAPSWPSLVETQISLQEIINSSHNDNLIEDDLAIDVVAKTTPIIICGRDLKVDEQNVFIDGNPLSASFFDFGLYVFHNAKKIAKSGSSPKIIIANIENYYEAKLWNELLNFTEQELGLESGTIKAIPILEDSLPEFEKKHINEELADHLLN
jgi:malate synthase